MSKPLFIPLKAEHFDAFASGHKVHEYRLAGGRWNEATCRVGRAVVLARGYGWPRLAGTIQGFSVSDEPCRRPEWQAIYGDKGPAAVIHIPNVKPIPQPPPAFGQYLATIGYCVARRYRGQSLTFNGWTPDGPDWIEADDDTNGGHRFHLLDEARTVAAKIGGAVFTYDGKRLI